MKKQKTRKQLESRIVALEKEKNTINEWIKKKEKQLSKNLEIVRKKGFFVGQTFTDYTEELKREVYSYVFDETLKENNDIPKTIISKMWSIEGAVSELANKQQRLLAIDEWVSKYQEEINCVYGELTQEQVNNREEDKKQKELYQHLKNEVDNIHSENLDKWLLDYKNMYIEHIEKNLDGWKKVSALEQVENIVREQKLTILIKSYPKVGKFKDIEFSTTGIDGTYNGFVIGEEGTCHIETILAGGYNIQRLHYRILVK